MSLREQLTGDLSTFLDVGEFAGSVEIDGVTVSCILDETEASVSSSRLSAMKISDGLTARRFTLYAASADLATPRPDQRMTFGDRSATVIDADETNGLLTVHLQWWDS